MPEIKLPRPGEKIKKTGIKGPGGSRSEAWGFHDTGYSDATEPRSKTPVKQGGLKKIEKIKVR